MIELKRASSEDGDFIQLIARLDTDLWNRYPQTQQNFIPHNTIKTNANAIIAYGDGEPVGCGCFRNSGPNGVVEIKRMYVVDQMRGKGIATAILRGLESWAVELGANQAILETGIKQPEAIALYAKLGYGRIENFGPYVNNAESICMGKALRKS